MRSSRWLPRHILTLAASLLALASFACSPIVTPMPEPTRATTAIPSASVAKPGHWEGEPSVSFDVTSEGDIHNFKIVAPFGVLAGQYCTVEIDEIVVGPDGTFAIGEAEDSPVYVGGEFTDATNLVGSYKITVCRQGEEATVVFDPEEESWSAAWRGVEKASEAPTAAPTTTPVPLATATSMPPTWTPAPTPNTPQAPDTASESTPSAGTWRAVLDLPRHINALVVDPHDPQVLYAGTGSTGAGSGVYKSEDAGLTWQETSSGLPSEDVRALAFSRAEPATLYAAVGSRGDVFASTDGAVTWKRLGNYALTGFEAALTVAPGAGDVLFVAEDVRGLYRSLDGGHNWTEVGQGLPKDEHGVAKVQSLATDPADADVVYVGTGWGSFNGNGVYKSTDGGETWAPANRGMIDYGISALAVSPADSQVVYAGGANGELFKSSDSAATWSEFTDRLPLENSFHQRVLDISIDPDRPETIYLLHERVGVLLSVDDGAQWRLLGSPSEPEHPTFTAMTVIFSPKPIVIVGIRDKGGWRYVGG